MTQLVPIADSETAINSSSTSLHPHEETIVIEEENTENYQVAAAMFGLSFWLNFLVPFIFFAIDTWVPQTTSTVAASTNLFAQMRTQVVQLSHFTWFFWQALNWLFMYFATQSFVKFFFLLFVDIGIYVSAVLVAGNLTFLVMGAL